MATEHFYLPNTLGKWPWPRTLNRDYAECKAESAAWCESYQAFSQSAQRAFNLCDFNLLASLAYAGLPKAVNRVGCDLMNLFFVYDEHSDAMDADSVRVWAAIIMDALRYPQKTRPKEEPIVGEITRTFWLNAMKCLGKTAQKRFIETFDTYTQSVVQQAEDRDSLLFRDVDSYMQVRRDTIGAKPSFSLLEHDMELPDEVFSHPLLHNLSLWCIDMLILGNDICSYNVEQSRGDDGHNIVKLIMLEENTDVHGAMQYVSDMHDRLADQFLQNFRRLPSWGEPIDSWVNRYVDGLGNWVRANDSWSFESWRYFKNDGLRIQKERWVELLPPVDADELTSSIPPESRWIQPSVIPGRPRPKNVGIVALEVYFPQQFVAVSELEALYRVSPEKSTSGLGQDYAALADEQEDINTLASSSVSSLMNKYSIDPRSIGRLEVGTETTAKDQQSIKSRLINLFASFGNTDIEGVDSKNPAAALFNAVNWIESSGWDGRYAIVLAGDIVACASDKTNIIGGAGACAMLVGPNAPIVVEPSHGTHVIGPSPGEPNVDSEKVMSGSGVYITAAAQAYAHFRNKYPKHAKATGINTVSHGCDTTGMAGQTHVANGGADSGKLAESLFTSFDFMIFQTPFSEVVKTAHAELLSAEAPACTFDDTEFHYQKTVSPSMLLENMCGNIGSGSVYGGLASLLTSLKPEALLGKRVGVFAFGAGTGAFFSLRFAGSTSVISKRMDLQQRLRDVEIISGPQLLNAVRLVQKPHSATHRPAGLLENVWRVISSSLHFLTGA